MHIQVVNTDGRYSETRPDKLLHIVRDLRGELDNDPSRYISPPVLPPSVPVFPPAPFVASSSYTADIFEATADVLDKTHSHYFYPVWKKILRYWFPLEEDFVIIQHWKIPFSASTHVSFAVLHRNRPLVLLQIHAASDGADEFGRLSARTLSSNQFDEVARRSDLSSLAVISAMGLKWSACVRSTDILSQEAVEILGDDWFGDWVDDAQSDESYAALEQHFDAIKMTLF